MKKLLKLTVIIAAASFLAGCAASSKNQLNKDAILPEIDVVQVKEKSDEALKMAQEVKLDVEVLNTKVTELDSRILALSEELSNVSSAKIEELETRLALLTEAYKDLLAQVKALDLASIHAKTARTTGPNATFSPSSASNLLVSPEYEAYQNGLRLFNGRNFEQAVRAFHELVQQFPGGKYADDAWFWSGDSYYSLADYSAAVSDFEKVLAFKGSAKADDAQYKMGLAYLKMGKQDKAKDAFRRLIERYPGSEYVSRAEKNLKQLK